MKPIEFSCEATFHLEPGVIASQILDLNEWPAFDGFGPIPGIERAEFESKTDSIVGSRIRVRNRDGSMHVEEIIDWDPARLLRFRMNEFTPPMSRLATNFEETWEFERKGDRTEVVRSFALHPKSALTRPLLWLISILLKRAIARHLEQLARKS